MNIMVMSSQMKSKEPNSAMMIKKKQLPYYMRFQKLIPLVSNILFNNNSLP